MASSTNNLKRKQKMFLMWLHVFFGSRHRKTAIMRDKNNTLDTETMAFSTISIG